MICCPKWICRRGRLIALQGLSLLLVVLASVCPAMAWGPTGHRVVTQVAVNSLPASSSDFNFIRRNESLLAFLSMEPDRWRDRDQAALRAANFPDHFIEFERIAFLATFPPDRYQFSRALSARRRELGQNRQSSQARGLFPEQVGLQPYVTSEIYGRLKIAWRQYRSAKAAGRPLGPVEQAILFYMGWLSHYVADGSQPLHTTRHYDGWEGTNPNGYSTGPGIHAKFEDAFLNGSGQAPVVREETVRARLLGDPFSDYLAYLRGSFSLVPRFYSLEKAGAFNGAGTPAGRQFLVERMLAGAEMLASLWHTAIQTSALPRSSP